MEDRVMRKGKTQCERHVGKRVVGSTYAVHATCQTAPARTTEICSRQLERNLLSLTLANKSQEVQKACIASLDCGGLPWGLPVPSQAEQTEESQEVRHLRGFFAIQRSRNPSLNFFSSPASDGELSCALGVPGSCT